MAANRRNSALCGLNFSVEVSECVGVSSAGKRRRDEGRRDAKKIYVHGADWSGDWRCVSRAFSSCVGNAGDRI